jgi:hypothetical protein
MRIVTNNPDHLELFQSTQKETKSKVPIKKLTGINSKHRLLQKQIKIILTKRFITVDTTRYSKELYRRTREINSESLQNDGNDKQKERIMSRQN